MTPDTQLGLFVILLILIPSGYLAWSEIRKARRLSRIRQNRRNYWEVMRS